MVDWYKIVRTVLVLLFGAAPVLPGAIAAALAAAMGLATLISSPLAGLVLLLWGLAGLAGSIAMWCAFVGRDDDLVRGGLVIGCIAIFPLAWAELMMGLDLGAIMVFGPPLTAMGLLVESSIKRRNERMLGGEAALW